MLYCIHINHSITYAYVSKKSFSSYKFPMPADWSSKRSFSHKYIKHHHCFYIHSAPLDVSANGPTDWIIYNGPPYISDLHIKLRIIPDFATGSPCGVWGRGRTICPLCDGPLGLCEFFLMTVGVYFGIWERIFLQFLVLVCLYITPIFLLIFLCIFYCGITSFYIK